MSATITQIAKEANVARPTVSRVLRGDPTVRVSEQTRKRVLEIRDRLGGLRLTRHTAARKKVRTARILLPVNIQQKAYAAKLLKTHALYQPLEQALIMQRGQLCIEYFDHEQRDEQIGRMIAKNSQYDGLLISGSVASPNLIDQVNRLKLPHVSLDPYDQSETLNTIAADEFGAMQRIVEHLEQLGHKHVAYMGTTRKRSRYSVFAAAIIRAGMTWNMGTVCSLDAQDGASRTPEQWREVARKLFTAWLKDHPVPSALCCHNDFIALGAIDVIRSRGLELGRDIAIVGYDNIEARPNDLGHPPLLTTIDNPLEQIAEHAVRRLIDQIEDGFHQIIHELLPTKLIVRSSTAPN